MAIYYADGSNSEDGRIIQVKTNTRTSAVSHTSLGANTMTSVILDCTITPKQSSSKIIIIVSMTVGCSTDQGIYGNLFSGSSQIARGDASGSRQRMTSFAATRNNDSHGNMIMMHGDNNGTTNATTYGVKLSHAGPSAVNVHVNRADSDQNAVQIGRGVSTITLYEVAQ